MNIDDRKEVRSYAPTAQGEGVGELIMRGILIYESA